MTILHNARRAARRIGLEVERATPMTVWRLRLPALLAHLGIENVIDVGANDGGFAMELIENGYGGKIVSFEALPSIWSTLNDRARHYGNGQWTVAPCMALGAETGEAEFYEAGNSVSSSLLRMTDQHVTAAPGSAPVTSHRVPVRCLDDVFDELGLMGDVYLKLDVQGAEGLVLSGAERTLTGAVKGIQLEMSLTELYDGQALVSDLDIWLRQRDFALWDIIPGFRDTATLRLMQYDGVYIRWH
jgi:FkbM family methyltransferase